MQIITTTELRTKSKNLVRVLREGKSVDLIHRSRIVGEIKPKSQGKIFDTKKFLKAISGLNLPSLSDEEIAKRYREEMEKKHGKGLLRHK